MIDHESKTDSTFEADPGIVLPATTERTGVFSRSAVNISATGPKLEGEAYRIVVRDPLERVELAPVTDEDRMSTTLDCCLTIRSDVSIPTTPATSH